MLETRPQQRQGRGRFGRADIPIVHAVLGGQLIISTSQAGLDAFRSAGPKLSSDPGFKAASAGGRDAEPDDGLPLCERRSLLPLAQLSRRSLGIDLPAGAQAGLGGRKTLTA